MSDGNIEIILDGQLEKLSQRIKAEIENSAKEMINCFQSELSKMLAQKQGS